MNARSTVPGRFQGFSPPALALLEELAQNNNRSWFAAHRGELEALLVRPALALVADIGPPLRRRISPGLRAEPRVGGSVLRMRHDARYVRDDPYRTHLEVWFWEGEGTSRDHPGYFVRLSADCLAIGAGQSQFDHDRLLRYRAAVDAAGPGRALTAVLHRLARMGWTVTSGRLARVPRPFPADHERADLLRLTGLRVEREQPLPAAVFGPSLPDLVVDELARLRPLVRWLCDA